MILLIFITTIFHAYEQPLATIDEVLNSIEASNAAYRQNIKQLVAGLVQCIVLEVDSKGKQKLIQKLADGDDKIISESESDFLATNLENGSKLKQAIKELIIGAETYYFVLKRVIKPNENEGIFSGCIQHYQIKKVINKLL